MSLICYYIELYVFWAGDHILQIIEYIELYSDVSQLNAECCHNMNIFVINTMLYNVHVLT